MKKPIFILLVICLLLLSSYIFHQNTGWVKGNQLEYIKENYKINDGYIVTGEYIATGQDQQGGFLIYSITTNHNETMYIRLDVEFHKHLGSIGPDFKIKGIREFDYYNSEIYELTIHKEAA